MFREYDLRGRVSADELNPRSAEIIGKAFGAYLATLKIKKAAVGYDLRSYSPRLARALIKGLLSTGIDIVDLGLCLVPMQYFALYHLKLRGGAMITASHNPNGWTGFKFSDGLSQTFGQEKLQQLYHICTDGKFPKGKGKIEKYDIFPAYAKDLLSRIKIRRKLKVVFDAGNGTPGKFVPEILRRAGAEVVELFCNLDVTFPNHDPNPSLPESRAALAKKVVAVGADVGISSDGDGDRLGVVDNKGKNIWADKVMIFLVRDILKQFPKSKIVYEVKCTRALEEEIKKANGEPIICRTGHWYIKQKAWEEGAVFGGERSGHIFFMKDYYGFDDAVFAALKLLEYLSGQTKPLSQLRQEIPQFVTSAEIHAPVPDEKKYQVVDDMVKRLIQKYGKSKVITVNGARVEFPDGWGLVRASANLPELSLIFEAKTKGRALKIKNEFKKMLAQYPEVSQKWSNENVFE